ncbi:MAG: hypothetical protein NTX22_10090 [Ignavibacteriales bacterium]|nr:hypothetical protein [Ignavibacteriales bacterium]
MKNLFLKSIVCFTFICINVAVFAQGSYKLQYNFQKGESYKYKITTDGVVTETMMGQEMKIIMDSKLYLKMETENRTPKNISLLVSLDSAKFHMGMPMKDTTMNLENFIGKRTRLVALATGKVIKKEIVDSVAGVSEMMGQISGETTKLIVLPEKEVKIGETWSSEDVDTINMMGGKIANKSNIDYTMVGKVDTLSHSCLKILFKGKTSAEGNAKIMGMDLFIEGNGKTIGFLYFDAEKGLMIHSSTQIDNEMTMAATGEQNQIIPISQITRNTYTIINK